jgi:hypothetical protein
VDNRRGPAKSERTARVAPDRYKQFDPICNPNQGCCCIWASIPQASLQQGNWSGLKSTAQSAGGEEPSTVCLRF